MAENGPRTQELVGEVRDLDRRMTDRGVDIQRRLTQLETKMVTVEGVLAGSGVDLEALKLSEKESKTQLRLIMGVGGLLGTLLVSLIVFASTRGG